MRRPLYKLREEAIARGEKARSERNTILKRYPSLKGAWRPIENLRRAARQIEKTAAASPMPSRFFR